MLCRSARWPRCEGPVGFREALASATGAVRLMLDPGGSPFPRIIAGSSAALLVGPEGGWTEKERDQARGAGWTLAGLPAGTLRAETAAVAAIVLARAAFDPPLRC